MKHRKSITVVLVGHVDHGKSTVLGRFLADTGALPDGKLDQVRATCERNSKPFEYAFLIDALKDEQSQGITIDSARIFYRGKDRDLIFIDAPGHIEFLRNMVTGAARAEAALLIIDAAEGVKENSKRHGFLLSMIGVKQVTVVVNKMDLVGYDQKRFNSVVSDFKLFLDRINVHPIEFIPVSGINGDNISSRSCKMPWYKGPSIKESLEFFKEEASPLDKPFRMPVQGVYKFTNFGDERRIIAGTVRSGQIKTGDEVVFYPSGKKSTIKSIESFNKKGVTVATAGQAVGFTLSEQIYVTRGELAITFAEPKPKVTELVKVSIFWLSKMNMVMDKDYVLKIGTSKAYFQIESIDKIFDLADLDSEISRSFIARNSLAECTIRLAKSVAFDLVSDFQDTGRFVIVDDHNIAGGGIVLAALEDDKSLVRKKVILRNYKWIKSMIPHRKRTEKYAQESAVVFITGKKEAPRKDISKLLEEELFCKDKLVYYLGLSNVLYGVDADIRGSGDGREEHLRRLAEVAHIMLDAGMILLVSAVELTADDLELMKIAIGQDKVVTVWVGKTVTTDLKADLIIDDKKSPGQALKGIMKSLVDKGIIHSTTLSRPPK